MTVLLIVSFLLLSLKRLESLNHRGFFQNFDVAFLFLEKAVSKNAISRWFLSGDEILIQFALMGQSENTEVKSLLQNIGMPVSVASAA